MRLIDADAMKKDLEENYVFVGFADLLNDIIEVIDAQPTADVVERKHGKWMKHSDRACWYCSECKEDNYYAYSWNSDTGKYEFQDHYCPNCGADMRERRDDDTLH